MPSSDLYCSSRTPISANIAVISGSYFLLREVDAQLGITIAARMPMIATMIISSSSEKPRWAFRTDPS